MKNKLRHLLCPPRGKKAVSTGFSGGLALLAFILILAELLLILASWLLSAMPSVPVRSLLSSEGVRWLMGHIAECLATPLLAWILLLGMGYECLRHSGLLASFSVPRASLPHRTRIAQWSLLAFLMAYVAVILLLTAVPHAILLSATGQLFPSPFSASIVPVVAFGLTMGSIIFGVMSGRFSTLSHIYEALVAGLRVAAPVILFYLLLIQLYFTAAFAFLF